MARSTASGVTAACAAAIVAIEPIAAIKPTIVLSTLSSFGYWIYWINRHHNQRPGASFVPLENIPARWPMTDADVSLTSAADNVSMR